MRTRKEIQGEGLTLCWLLAELGWRQSCARRDFKDRNQSLPSKLTQLSPHFSEVMQEARRPKGAISCRWNLGLVTNAAAQENSGYARDSSKVLTVCCGNLMAESRMCPGGLAQKGGGLDEMSTPPTNKSKDHRC